MLRISLEKLVAEVSARRGAKVTLAEISDRTGVHRNILSRMLNRPDENSSTEHLDKLAQFFFYEIKTHPKESEQGNLGELTIMQRVIKDLIEIFPTQGQHAAFLARLNEEDSNANLPIHILWRLYRSEVGDEAFGDKVQREKFKEIVKERIKEKKIKKPKQKS